MKNDQRLWKQNDNQEEELAHQLSDMFFVSVVGIMALLFSYTIEDFQCGYIENRVRQKKKRNKYQFW